MERKRADYPQVDYIDDNGTQWIELNRGCKRGCSFCYADPNYKTFECPEIKARIVQIVGEGFLYDPEIKRKIKELGKNRYQGKVVYFGLSQGIDFRLIDEETALLLAENRVGIINGKGRWYKGMRFAWDFGLEHEGLARKTVELLERAGFKRKYMQVFLLTNWKISLEICMKKLEVLKELGVKVDDCTYNTTKKEKKAIHWTRQDIAIFRRAARKHNHLILFDGFDPEPPRDLNQAYLPLPK